MQWPSLFSPGWGSTHSYDRHSIPCPAAVGRTGPEHTGRAQERIAQEQHTARAGTAQDSAHSERELQFATQARVELLARLRILFVGAERADDSLHGLARTRGVARRT
jgi:hypothetical protein